MRYLTNTRPVSTIDQIFDSMFYGNQTSNNVYSSFPVDATEEENRYVITAELPGFNDSDVNITLNDNLLVISAEHLKKAEKKKEKEEKEYKYLLRERVQRKYKRTFTLPKDADREEIKASMKEGLLELSIGKKEEAKPVTIKIN